MFGPSPIFRLLRPLLTSVRSPSSIAARGAVFAGAIAVCFARCGRQHPLRLDLDQPVGPAGTFAPYLHRLVEQISPNKNMSFPCTTAAFTLSAVTLGLRDQVPTRPQTGPSMRFLSVGSHVCTWASSRQTLAGLPLPSASGYPDDIGSSHRGLSPHKLMPMSGVHPSLQRTGQQRRYACCEPAAEFYRWAAPASRLLAR